MARPRCTCLRLGKKCAADVWWETEGKWQAWAEYGFDPDLKYDGPMPHNGAERFAQPHRKSKGHSLSREAFCRDVQAWILTHGRLPCGKDIILPGYDSPYWVKAYFGTYAALWQHCLDEGWCTWQQWQQAMDQSRRPRNRKQALLRRIREQ